MRPFLALFLLTLCSSSACMRPRLLSSPTPSVTVTGVEMQTLTVSESLPASSSLIPADVCLPAVGQGALAIEARTEDKEVRDMLSFLNDLTTKQATDAERAFLGLLEGGCQVPIGVHADVEGENIRIEAIIAALDGSNILRDTINGKADDAVSLGQQLGKKMLAAGGQEILASIL